MTRTTDTSKTDGAPSTLEGVIERVVYTQDDSGWTVVRLRRDEKRPLVTAVGRLPGIKQGESVRLEGDWAMDARYGRQFRVARYVVSEPAGAAAIQAYLGSGLIPGIGKEMARRLVERFGEKTLEVIEQQPERLSEVSGIGKVRSRKIQQSLLEHRDRQETMLFLQSIGLSARQALKIERHYGDETAVLLRQNPYRLAYDIYGIGFRRADDIARQMGATPDSPDRLRAGLLHALDQAAERGHLFLPRQELLTAANELLGVAADPVAEALSSLVANRDLVEEPLHGSAVYRRELYAAERGVEQALRRLMEGEAERFEVDAPRAIAWFEGRQGFELAAAQRQAVAQALHDKMLVITGGPGTGKTTLVRAVCEILARKGQRIALAAPTGRAANRLAETTGLDARTVHRLLEFDGHRRRFLRHRDRPLKLDWLLVDESSMLDIVLTFRLLEAVPESAHVIFIGDADQLPSVGPGSVLDDIIRSEAVPVVRLSEIFRQARQSLIVRSAHRINRGHMPKLDGGSQSDFHFIHRASPDEIISTIRRLVAERIPQGLGLDPRVDVQVLAPMRRGVLGTENLNGELQSLLNPGGRPVPVRPGLRVGDRVMQIRNNYDLDVFNGEIGSVTGFDEEERTLRVAFNSRRVDYSLSELDELTLSYACSIHKSQGSEFRCVVLVLHGQHYHMLERTLLYTAVTRGREQVIIVGDRKAVAQAVRTARAQSRNTLLAERLRHRSK